MAYRPVISGGPGISDGTIVFADLAFSLQSLIGGGSPIGAAMDFEGFTLPTGWLWEDGAAVSRATYSDLFDAITITQTGTLNATTTISGLTSTKGIRVGAAVEGTNIPSGATVASIVSTTVVTISTPATGSGSTPITFLPHGGGDGSTTFNTPDARGRTSVGMDDLGGNGDAGVLDATQIGVGHATGQQTVALTPAQTPLRTHTHSGTSSAESVTHNHTGTTDSESVDHAHGTGNGQLFATTSFVAQIPSGGVFAAINGAVGTTAGRNAGHTHSFTTGNASVTHTHTLTTGTPSVAEANGAAHENMQPSRLVNRIVYAGV